LQAAISMLESLDRFNRTYMSDTKQPIHIGIGLNSGKLMLGTVGEEHALEDTVISDEVNVAFRIQDSTKLYGTPLLITEETYRRLKQPDKYAIRKIEKILVRGRMQYITVYEVFENDPDPVSLLKKQTQADFENGVYRYHEKKYTEA